MKLEEVIEEFRNGKSIRRTDWYKLHSINKLSTECYDCDNLINAEDVMSDDWEIVE